MPRKSAHQKREGHFEREGKLMIAIWFGLILLGMLAALLGPYIFHK